MQYHEVANLFPMMNDDEYAALVADIHQHGQREAIWVLDGKILDGRNRFSACNDLGIQPIIQYYDGDPSTNALVSFVVSLNLKRRHLTSPQLAFVALEIEKVLAFEATKQKQETGRMAALAQHDPERVYKKIDKPIDSLADAAAIVGTNRQYVSDAKKLTAQAPDLADEVRAGTLSMTDARREIKERERVQARQDRADNPPAVLPDNCTIEHGDSITHMVDNSIHAIITDPPYGISHYGGITKVGDQLVTANFDGDDAWDSVDPAEFVETLFTWCEEWERVLKPGGAVIAFTDRALVSHLWDAMKRVDLRPKQIITWVKTNPSPAGLARKNLISATEYMVWAVKPGAPYVFNEVDGWNRHNVITTPIIGGHEKVDHPTQKPIAVLSKLIALTSNPGDLVLDPFAGSGSTGEAAILLGRRAHLIEQNIDYVRLAQARIAAVDQDVAA